MRSSVLIAAIPLLAAACLAPGEQEKRVANDEIIPARDGNIAIIEEYRAARKAGTVAALNLFIVRHPRHPLADKARIELDKLQR